MDEHALVPLHTASVDLSSAVASLPGDLGIVPEVLALLFLSRRQLHDLLDVLCAWAAHDGVEASSSGTGGAASTAIKGAAVIVVRRGGVRCQPAARRIVACAQSQITDPAAGGQQPDWTLLLDDDSCVSLADVMDSATGLAGLSYAGLCGLCCELAWQTSQGRISSCQGQEVRSMRLHALAMHAWRREASRRSNYRPAPPSCALRWQRTRSGFTGCSSAGSLSRRSSPLQQEAATRCIALRRGERSIHQSCSLCSLSDHLPP
jgi:hypothetical protein